MSVNWIEYKGKRIIYADFRGLDFQQMLENLELGIKILKESHDKALAIYDFRDVSINPEFMKRVKPYGKQIIAPKTEKSAILGVVGIKKILFSAYMAFSKDKIKVFDSEEEAKEYVIS